MFRRGARGFLETGPAAKGASAENLGSASVPGADVHQRGLFQRRGHTARTGVSSQRPDRVFARPETGSATALLLQTRWFAPQYDHSGAWARARHRGTVSIPAR